MSSWTLRKQRLERTAPGPQRHSAALRAYRVVRRHANEFHGADVADAVQWLTAETAHGLTVVGWKGTNGCAYCPEHRPSGATPVTAADLTLVGAVHCLACGVKL